jgi:oligopeptide transport system ATP-binding protein
MNNVTQTPLLTVQGIKKNFPIKSGLFLRHSGNVRAVDNVSFMIPAGETLGLVGESGCGKTTLGRILVGIYEPTEGSVTFQGETVAGLNGSRMMKFRKNVTMVFQDPFSSLNPRMTVFRILESPLRIHGVGSKEERRARVEKLLDVVGLGKWAAHRYPHEFSGGQRQRIAIARALALNPKIVILDEPVSALDVSVQAQILNLLKDLQDQFGIAFLFIAHNLAVVKHISQRVAVMYLGKIVEMAEQDELFNNPKHPYTQALIESNPVPGVGPKSERRVLGGDIPSPLSPPTGCAFHPRCPLAEKICREEAPPLIDSGNALAPHWVSCHLVKPGGIPS